MEEDLITFETAKLAKKVGLNILTNRAWSDKDSRAAEYHHFYFFNDDEKVKDHYRFPLYSAPTQSVLQKWIRENHMIDIHFGRTGVRDIWNLDGISKFGYPFIESKHRFKTEFKSYEDALESGLIEALKSIKV